jgi:soluble P-type ATPase
MIRIDIPGREQLNLKYLVLDYNGTLACDGILMPGLKSWMIRLSEELDVHVLTADTFGSVHEQLGGFACQITVIPVTDQSIAKLEFIRNLGAECVVAVGNGRNDSDMLKAAALGIIVIQEEGAAVQSIQNADVVCNSIIDVFGLLLNPKRLVATLRN